jgi:DNA polymerase I-like protein with 3'-5' exonuclease and polymerase domains
MNIKECFTSRFEGGYLIEADFSQLEVVGLAILTGDKQLMEDIREGRDMHCISASFLSGEKYEDIYTKYKAGDAKYATLRKSAKQPSFQLQYGSGAKSMSDSCKLPLKTCQEFIDNYYTRYSGVKQWQEDIANTVENGRKPSGRHTKGGFPAGESTIVTATGRRYTFMEYDAPMFMHRKGTMTSFSPTEIKNYPVQGFATGDIVPHMLGVIYRELLGSRIHKDCLMVNTIHDSVLFDCKAEVLAEACKMIYTIMCNTSETIAEFFNINIPLPLKCSIEVGYTWYEMDKYVI